ncbi:hypothetical protein J6590_098016, partial [Homalodisca vitripennis]
CVCRHRRVTFINQDSPVNSTLLILTPHGTNGRLLIHSVDPNGLAAFPSEVFRFYYINFIALTLGSPTAQSLKRSIFHSEDSTFLFCTYTITVPKIRKKS